MEAENVKRNHSIQVYADMNEQPPITKKGPDTSKMILVPITKRTSVYFPKGVNIKKAVAKWIEAHKYSQF